MADPDTVTLSRSGTEFAATRVVTPASALRRRLPSRLYAKPPIIPDDTPVHWYHSMVLPVSGEVTGEWDLRPTVDDYLGHVDYAGKRVLEIGPASGYLTFEMERRGAEVVCVELPPGAPFDMVPFASVDQAALLAEQGSEPASVAQRLLARTRGAPLPRACTTATP